MSILNFIKKICVQPAVYWGNPVDDGFGNKMFDQPIEIKVRWDDVQRIITALNGKEIVSKATILSPLDLDIEGYIYLGTLDSLIEYDESGDSDDSSDDSSDSDESGYIGTIKHPKEIDGAYEIIAPSKTPLIKSNTKFVKEYILGFRNV